MEKIFFWDLSWVFSSRPKVGYSGVESSRKSWAVIASRGEEASSFASKQRFELGAIRAKSSGAGTKAEALGPGRFLSVVGFVAIGLVLAKAKAGRKKLKKIGFHMASIPPLLCLLTGKPFV